MARTIGKLTALAVTQAKRRGYYGDGGGLFLQVSASEAKSWVFCFKEAGKLRQMGLGATYTVSLAEARQKALECRKARLDDLDPIDVRRGKRIQAKLDAAKAMTFAACAERYIASHKAGWRTDLRRCKPRACRLALYILGCGVIGLVAVSLLIDYTKPGRLAEIRRRVGRLKLALRGDGATRPSRQTRWWRKEGSNRRSLSVTWNRNLGGGVVSKSVVLSPGDRGVRGHDVEPDVRARLDRRVVNRGIKREPAEAAEELRLDRLAFSDVPPLAMRRWRRSNPRRSSMGCAPEENSAARSRRGRACDGSRHY